MCLHVCLHKGDFTVYIVLTILSCGAVIREPTDAAKGVRGCGRRRNTAGACDYSTTTTYHVLQFYFSLCNGTYRYTHTQSMILIKQ